MTQNRKNKKNKYTKVKELRGTDFFKPDKSTKTVKKTSGNTRGILVAGQGMKQCDCGSKLFDTSNNNVCANCGS
jgi:hypothetical protein